MRPGRFVALMYHEIEAPGHPPRESAPGYLRYVVREQEFSAQLATLQRLGLRGVSLTDALEAGREGNIVALTFDDGSATDRTIAAGLLGECGFGATFFVVPGFLGQRGYLSGADVRALSGAGFEIGSHSMEHRFLTTLSTEPLRQDLARSKGALEALCGRPVRALSCPGGRWNRRVAEAAAEAGYATVATSRPGVNDSTTDRLRMQRIVIRRETGEAAFGRRLQGQRLGGERLRETLLGGLRTVLGDANYHRLQQRWAR
jgi:peptidoglycan/xylan/chitin deacetylase (PgdA/CDA1 family)